MESKIIIACVLVAALGIAAAAAGFAAEATRIKKPKLTLVYVGLKLNPKVECEYQSSPGAMGLAIAATVALLMARVTVSLVTGGCCSCCQTIRTLPRFAQICVVISWITGSVAVILFMVGATLSSERSVQRGGDGEYHCYIVRPGIFSGAAIMTLLSVLLALVYELSFASASNVVVKTSRLVDLGVATQPITNGKKPPNPSQKH